MRSALWAVSLLALFSVSCADGTDELPPQAVAGNTAGTGGAGGTSGPSCGDMQISLPAEQCDPPGPTTMTCMDLGMVNMPGSMVMCSAACKLETSMCGAPGGGGGNTSVGGNGG